MTTKEIVLMVTDYYGVPREWVMDNLPKAGYMSVEKYENEAYYEIMLKVIDENEYGKDCRFLDKTNDPDSIYYYHMRIKEDTDIYIETITVMIQYLSHKLGVTDNGQYNINVMRNLWDKFTYKPETDPYKDLPKL